MVETREALDRVDEIAATPGLGGIYVGPSDLSLSLGLPLTLAVREDEHAEAIERVREACARNGIAAGIHSPSGAWARGHAEAGFDMVTVATDASLLRGAALSELASARSEQNGAGEGKGFS
jgi:4-hydroxy-2-oxoheptanedioate aldolase